MATRVLYCHCAFAQAVPRPVKQDVLRGLAEAGGDFDAVADLCEMSARKDPALRELAASEHLTVVACYPRAVRWLFSAAGAPLDESRVRCLNMRAATAAEITAALASEETTPGSFSDAAGPADAETTPGLFSRPGAGSAALNGAPLDTPDAEPAASAEPGA